MSTRSVSASPFHAIDIPVYPMTRTTVSRTHRDREILKDQVTSSFVFFVLTSILIYYLSSTDLLDLVLKFFIQDAMNILINVSQSSPGSASAAEGQGP